MLGSDYSAGRSGCKHDVYAFLIADEEASPEWPALRHAIRQNHLPDGRRLSFKRLADGQRQRALVPFLDAADSLTGHLVVLLVDKRLRGLSTGRNSLRVWQELHGLHGKWDQTAFEKLARVVHIFAILVGMWSRPFADISWITDEDEIVANDARLTDALLLAERFSGLYTSHQLGTFAMNSTAIDDTSRGFEDFVAIPDLVAGALAELVTAWANSCPSWYVDDNSTLDPSLLSHKTNVISAWFSTRSAMLRRTAVLVERVGPTDFHVVDLDFGR